MSAPTCPHVRNKGPVTMPTPYSHQHPSSQCLDDSRAGLEFDLRVAASRVQCARALPPGLDRAREIGTAAEHHRAIQAALDALGRRAHG